MAEFLTDPSMLTKDKLKSALVANNVALPNGEQRKGVYVELYLKNLTSQNRRSAEAFSSDEEAPVPGAGAGRSGRKATRKTDRVRPEEIDVTELTDEELKEQLLKYGVSAGPIVASTRKVYEKKLQKMLDQGPPQTSIIALPEPVLTHRTRNGSADSDQYSDKEEETRATEPEPEPEPVPVVERPLRSRGKTPVTTRTRSSQHRNEEDEMEEEDPELATIERKSRRSSRRLDRPVPDSVSASEMLPVPQDGKRFPAIPKDPELLLAATMPRFPSVSEDGLSGSPERRPASDDQDEAVSTDKFYKRVHLTVRTVGPRRSPSPSQPPETKRSESAAALSKAPDEEVQLSPLDTALLEVGPREVLNSRPAHADSFKSVSLSKLTKERNPHRSASPQPSRELIHTMCRLSPSPAGPPGSRSLVESPCRPARDLPGAKSSPGVKPSGGSAAAVQSRIDGFFSPVTPHRGRDSSPGDQTPGGLIEKLSAVEQTPKTAERDVLKEMFPSEVLSTPTGISATRRQPIKGAAGRPFSETWQDSPRPRLTEHRYTSSSYTETRSAPRLGAAPRLSVAPRLSAVPLSVPKPAAPPSVQAKSRRRVPVWVQLLLLSAVAGFLLFVYQTMESNQLSPFGQPGNSVAQDASGK